MSEVGNVCYRTVLVCWVCCSTVVVCCCVTQLCWCVLLKCVGVLQVERLMDMLRRREYETTSVISEEDSTTDSGRGASEEGDHGHLNSG